MFYYHNNKDPYILCDIARTLARRYAIAEIPMDDITVRKVLGLLVTAYQRSTTNYHRAGAYSLMELFLTGNLSLLGWSLYEKQICEPDTALVAHQIAILNHIEGEYLHRLKIEEYKKKKYLEKNKEETIN